MPPSLAIGLSLGQQLTSLSNAIAGLFANGEQGWWLDPSDISTLFQDSAGTTPVTALGQPVGKILDKSGRGNHFIQATAGKRPIYSQDAGGYFYLAFDGTSASMASAATINLTGGDKLTLWVGVRKTSDSATRFICEFSSTGANDGSFSMSAPTGANHNYGVTTRGTTALAGPAYTTFTAPITNVLSCQLNNAGSGSGASAQVKTRINAIAQANVSATTDANYTNSTLYLGARTNSNFFLSGNIYGLIGRAALSSTSQVLSGEAYMNSKTGAY